MPSTLVNVTAWLAMKSSSVAGAVVSADVRQPLALTFLSSPVISGAPGAAAAISSSPSASGQHVKSAPVVSILLTASMRYVAAFGMIGAGGGLGGSETPAANRVMSTQPPQSRWSIRATVHSCVSALFCSGSVHVMS